jgi:hypothetical protein
MPDKKGVGNRTVSVAVKPEGQTLLESDYILLTDNERFHLQRFQANSRKNKLQKNMAVSRQHVL